MKKMSFIVILLSTAAVLCGAIASAAAETTMTETTAMDLAYLANSNTAQTPYQKLEAYYNRATPMQLSQFMTPTSPELKYWHCTYMASPTTKQSRLMGDMTVPVLVTGTIVSGQSVPGAGPLFPGKPTKNLTVFGIWNIANDGTFKETHVQIGKDIVKAHETVKVYPYVSDSGLLDSTDSKSGYTDTYRTIDNLVIGRQVVSDTKYYADAGYWYCWEQIPTK